MEKYTMIREIKADIKLFKFIYLSDLIFLAVWIFVGVVFLQSFVYTNLRTWFIVIHSIFGFIMRADSPYNKNKKIYQGLILRIKRDSNVYKPITYIPRDSNKTQIIGNAKMYGDFAIE
ncbi:MAG: DUF5592 family protein [Ruminococcus sp.]